MSAPLSRNDADEFPMKFRSKWKTLKRRYGLVKRNVCKSGDMRFNESAVAAVEMNLPNVYRIRSRFLEWLNAKQENRACFHITPLSGTTVSWCLLFISKMSLSFTQICNRNPAYDLSTTPGPAKDVRRYVHLNVSPLLGTKTDGQVAYDSWKESRSINAHNGLSYVHTCLQRKALCGAYKLGCQINIWITELL